MYTDYYCETITRQRTEEAARGTRTALHRRQIKTRTGWHFPQLSFPGRPHVAIVRPA